MRRLLTVTVFIAVATGCLFDGAAAGSSTAADQLSQYGAGIVRPPYFPLYGFSVSCSALPCKIKLSERAFVRGHRMAALDRVGGPPIVMSQPSPSGRVFVVWFQRSDFNQHLLFATVRQYGGVRLDMTAALTDAQGNKVKAKRTVYLWPTLVVVRCSNGYVDIAKVRPRNCAFHRVGAPQDSADMAPVVGMTWNGWGSPAATASGTFVGNMGFRTGATVQLSRLTACPSLHEAVYRAATITGQGLNPYTWSLQGCV